MSTNALDIVYSILEDSKDGMTFDKIWKAVSKEVGVAAAQEFEKMAETYTQLTLDKRFINLGQNKWDLRSKHAYDKVHISMGDVYTDIEMSKEIDSTDDDLPGVISTDDDY